METKELRSAQPHSQEDKDVELLSVATQLHQNDNTLDSVSG